MSSNHQHSYVPKKERKDTPVDNYRREIGGHQERILKPSQVKKRLNKMNQGSESVHEDSQSNFKKFLIFLLVCIVIFASLWFLLHRASIVGKYPFYDLKNSEI